jgi:hypothetical protein
MKQIQHATAILAALLGIALIVSGEPLGIVGLLVAIGGQ